MFIVLFFRRAKDFCLARICGGIVAIFILCNLPRLAIGGFEVVRLYKKFLSILDNLGISKVVARYVFAPGHVWYLSILTIYIPPNSIEFFLQLIDSLGSQQYCSALKPTCTTLHQSLRWSKLGLNISPGFIWEDPLSLWEKSPNVTVSSYACTSTLHPLSK